MRNLDDEYNTDLTNMNNRFSILSHTSPKEKKRIKKKRRGFSCVACPFKNKQIINDNIIWVLLMISASSCQRSLCVLVKMCSFELF